MINDWHGTKLFVHFILLALPALRLHTYTEYDLLKSVCESFEIFGVGKHILRMRCKKKNMEIRFQLNGNVFH